MRKAGDGAKKKVERRVKKKIKDTWFKGILSPELTGFLWKSQELYAVHA